MLFKTYFRVFNIYGLFPWYPQKLSQRRLGKLTSPSRDNPQQPEGNSGSLQPAYHPGLRHLTITHLLTPLSSSRGWTCLCVYIWENLVTISTLHSCREKSESPLIWRSPCTMSGPAILLLHLCNKWFFGSRNAADPAVRSAAQWNKPPQSSNGGDGTDVSRKPLGKN